MKKTFKFKLIKWFSQNPKSFFPKKSLKEIFADITLSKTLEICHASTLGYFLPKTPCARVFPKTSFE